MCIRDRESSVPWLTSDALGGALGPMATSEVTLTLDHEYAATLPIGDYPADIVFTDRDHPDGELVMAFLLTVEAGKDADEFDTFADRARARGWQVVQMEGSHNPHWFQPEAFVHVLENTLEGVEPLSHATQGSGSNG